MPLHAFVFHGCACTDYACEFHTTAVWSARPKYRAGPFLNGDRGHVEAYLITLYEAARKVKTIQQEMTFKQFTQYALPKPVNDWLNLEGIWEGAETPGTQTVASKQRMNIVNAPLNCGGRCNLCYYVCFKRGDRADRFCCDGGLFLHQGTSVTDPDEGGMFLRDLAAKRLELHGIVFKRKSIMVGRPGVHPKLYYLDVEDANVLSYLNSHTPPKYPDFIDDNKEKTETVDNLARKIKTFKEIVVMASTP